ncbi:MAG TPA: DUF1489 domain-containing protein [Acetobacteraceae bacterium]|nr:DUF1489 domain-containing protein [Acetobacteraceae bacterium]
MRAESPPLNIVKLAVGVRDAAHLRALQAERLGREPPLRHRTRNFPRRAAEIAGKGSLFWVIGGLLRVRQRILDVIEDRWQDGSACAAFVLDPALVLVAPRVTKPFQGWRYLSQADAPPDVAAGRAAAGAARLPEVLRQELAALCLL